MKKLIANLAAVCESAGPEDTAPRKKPNKSLYSRLYNSACTKFPSLDDYLDSEKSTGSDRSRLFKDGVLQAPNRKLKKQCRLFRNLNATSTVQCVYKGRILAH
jgi:hypothetical protein